MPGPDTEKKFREAYNLYYPLIMNIILKKARNRSDAEDICQEVFAGFYAKIAEVNNHRNWLLGAVKYACSNYYQRKSSRADDTDDIDDVLNDGSTGFTNGFRDTRILLQEVLNSDEPYRDELERSLYIMTAINGFTRKEAAGHLGLSRSQVDYKLATVTKKIIEILKRKGIENIEDLL